MLSNVFVLCFFYIRKSQRLNSSHRNLMCWLKSRKSSLGSCSCSRIKRPMSPLRWVHTYWIPSCIESLKTHWKFFRNVLSPLLKSVGDRRYKREADIGPQSHQDSVSWSGDKNRREGRTQIHCGLPCCWEDSFSRYVENGYKPMSVLNWLDIIYDLWISEI